MVSYLAPGLYLYARFLASKYDCSLYHWQSREKIIVLRVKVDWYLHVEAPTTSQQLETTLQDQFNVGTFESEDFDIMGASSTQNISSYATLSAKGKSDVIPHPP